MKKMICFVLVSECEDCGASKYYWESQPCAGPPCAVIMGIEDKEAVIK